MSTETNDREKLLAENAKFREALEFYANPETYHGVAFLMDPPGGGWAEDFSEDHGNNGEEQHYFYNRPMPGKLARKTIDWKNYVEVEETQP